MSADDDFTAYVGTRWSTLVRTALLLGCDAPCAELVVADALVGSYQRWARVWQDDRADLEVLTRLLGGIYEPSGRSWRGEGTGSGPASSPATAGADTDDTDPPELVRDLRPLGPLHRDALVLRYVAELDELGLAEVLDIRPVTAQQRLDQALATLRPARTEQHLVAQVEHHRREQLIGLPPTDLLARAHDVRRQRRRRTAAITAGVLSAVVLLSGAVHLVRGLGQDPPAAAALTGPPPWARHPSGPTTRLVGLNGWAVRVPGSWGTDQVACDGVTAARPTVLFANLLTAAGACRAGPPQPYVLIGDEPFHGVPWRTIGGVAVLRHPHACAVCARLRVPSSAVTFQIRANNSVLLHRIERSLQPLAPRQVTVPVGEGSLPLDRMVTIATGAGLRPRVLEAPSRQPPGTFLRAEPPIGTPVDLGTSIALYFSTGDLGPYATNASLRRHGWRLFGVAVAPPPYQRRAAVHAALGRSARPSAHPTFLRTLTITHDGPRGVVVRRRLVWLVVGRAVGDNRPGASSITAVDAATGQIIEVQRGFRGRRKSVVR
jgi:hypothetical protein